MKKIAQFSLAGLASVAAVAAFVYLRDAVDPYAEHRTQEPAAIDPHAEHRKTTPTTSPDALDRVPVSLDPSKAQGLGTGLEQVRREPVARSVRAVATVVPDEARLAHVHTRVSGWVERLHVNTTGQHVKAGKPVAEIFSQELLASQSEYLAARQALPHGGSEAVVKGARSRLRVLGMGEGEIRSLEKRGEPRSLVTVSAPIGGVVLRRAVTVGAAVDPSTEIVTIADLSKVWVLAEVSERDARDVVVGARAVIHVPASGLEPFEAEVEFVYPTLSERTRTLRVRFTAPNDSGGLRPGMYGTATFHAAAREALTIPRDAVVDTGARQYVFVAGPDGELVPRRVVLGVALEDRVEVREGLVEQDRVVASGVFLIDSESRLRASGGGTGHMHGSAAQSPEANREAPPAEPASANARSLRPTAPPSSNREGYEGHEGLEGLP